MYHFLEGGSQSSDLSCSFGLIYRPFDIISRYLLIMLSPPYIQLLATIWYPNRTANNSQELYILIFDIIARAIAIESKSTHRMNEANSTTFD